MERTMSARERLIQATSHLVELQGYHATGLNQIIKEGGAPKGSLYYYFPNGKEELVAESVAIHGQAVTEQIRKALANTTDPAEAIYAIITYVASKFEHSDFIKAGSIASVALETAHISERLRKVCGEIYMAWRSAYESMLIEHGMMSDKATRIATLITASIEGAVVLCRTYRSSEPMLFIAEELKQLIEQARKQV
ncbi:TetR/AcrR family transcriptional regulator [Paenibacillus sedimenti]|uniref:TetR/AcrR family transcriptional regulator n=1 Tax=Paenibacillus sedimenti TaxID=2770274 RepID=A0A926QIG1_9BACL|nr:TetR/AcrR family transcriptional regulator [Paenibacillus sedimenti]MBD0380470.1 TetR/AcrR family transcriptional regulator [Paenibacillus sedimenti]